MATFQTITTDKKQYLPLLLLADPCEAMIDRYLEAGDMHVLSIGDAPVCVAVVIPYSDTACELKNLATDPQFQKQGYATRLMETLFKFSTRHVSGRCMWEPQAPAWLFTPGSVSRTRTPSPDSLPTTTPNHSMKTAFSSRTCFTSKKSWPDRKAPGKTPMDFIEQYLRFIKEAERLKAVTRTAWTHDGRRESTAEHSWRLALFAGLAAGRLPGLNREKVLMMSLIHDMGELYGGDISAALCPDPQEKTDEESRAVRKAFSLLPEREAESLLALWREYNANATPEARLVKALDKAETIIQHNQGRNPEDFDYRFNLGYGKEYFEGSGFLRELRTLLDEETAAKLHGTD